MTRRDRGQKKMIYKTVTEEDGLKNTTTFRPADLHDNQNGADTLGFTLLGARVCCSTSSPVFHVERVVVQTAG